MDRVFANGPRDLGSIPGQVIPKTQKMVLEATLLNTQQYMVRIKDKVEQSREGVAPSPTPQCSSYRKGRLRVTLDFSRQLFIHLEKSLSDETKRATFCENTFNGARCLTCQTLWLLVLFQYKRVSEPCMTNAQLGYYELFSS